MKLPSSFDVIGSKEKAIAIIESSTNKKEKEIAKKIMKQHKNIVSVLKKTSKRKGEFRKREYKLVLGSRNLEIIHKEYGYFLKLNPIDTYFSPRESTERQRITSQIKKMNPYLSCLVVFVHWGLL